MSTIGQTYSECVTKVVAQTVERFGASELAAEPTLVDQLLYDVEVGRLHEALKLEFPELLEGVTCGDVHWRPDPTNLLRFGIMDALRQARFETEGSAWPNAASRVGEEFAEFLQADYVEVLVVARISGLHLDQGVDFTFNGSVPFRVARIDGRMRHLLGIDHELWLEGETGVSAEVRVPMRCGAKKSGDAVEGKQDTANEVLQLVRAFQVALNRKIGCGELRELPRKFTPLPGLRREWLLDRFFSDHVALENHHASLVEDLFRVFRGKLHPSLRLAIDRFGQSCTRNDAGDQILDASIGLEAILLCGDNSELKYRFGLNFASLFEDPSERRRALDRARAFYDVRSAIAHGSTPSAKKLRACCEEGTLHGAARVGRDMLRECILRFHTRPDPPEYLQNNYWEDQVISLRGRAADEV